MDSYSGESPKGPSRRKRSNPSHLRQALSRTQELPRSPPSHARELSGAEPSNQNEKNERPLKLKSRQKTRDEFKLSSLNSSLAKKVDVEDVDSSPERWRARPFVIKNPNHRRVPSMIQVRTSTPTPAPSQNLMATRPEATLDDEENLEDSEGSDRDVTLLNLSMKRNPLIFTYGACNGRLPKMTMSKQVTLRAGRKKGIQRIALDENIITDSSESHLPDHASFGRGSADIQSSLEDAWINPQAEEVKICDEQQEPESNHQIGYSLATGEVPESESFCSQFSEEQKQAQVVYQDAQQYYKPFEETVPTQETPSPSPQRIGMQNGLRPSPISPEQSSNHQHHQHHQLPPHAEHSVAPCVAQFQISSSRVRPYHKSIESVEDPELQDFIQNEMTVQSLEEQAVNLFAENSALMKMTNDSDEEAKVELPGAKESGADISPYFGTACSLQVEEGSPTSKEDSKLSFGRQPTQSAKGSDSESRRDTELTEPTNLVLPIAEEGIEEQVERGIPEMGQHLQLPPSNQVQVLDTEPGSRSLKKSAATSTQTTLKRFRNPARSKERSKERLTKERKSKSRKRLVAPNRAKISSVETAYKALREKQVEEFHAFLNRLKAQYLGIPLHSGSQPIVLLEGTFIKTTPQPAGGHVPQAEQMIKTMRNASPESVYRSRTPQNKNTRLEEKRLRPSVSSPDISKSIYNPSLAILSSALKSSSSSCTPILTSCLSTHRSGQSFRSQQPQHTQERYVQLTRTHLVYFKNKSSALQKLKVPGLGSDSHYYCDFNCKPLFELNLKNVTSVEVKPIIEPSKVHRWKEATTIRKPKPSSPWTLNLTYLKNGEESSLSLSVPLTEGHHFEKEIIFEEHRKLLSRWSAKIQKQIAVLRGELSPKKKPNRARVESKKERPLGNRLKEIQIVVQDEANEFDPAEDHVQEQEGRRSQVVSPIPSPVTRRHAPTSADVHQQLLQRLFSGAGGREEEAALEFVSFSNQRQQTMAAAEGEPLEATPFQEFENYPTQQQMLSFGEDLLNQAKMEESDIVRYDDSRQPESSKKALAEERPYSDGEAGGTQKLEEALVQIIKELERRQ